MATKYIDSSATGGTQAGTSWANAFLTLAASYSNDSAGDVFYVASTHNETTALTGGLTFSSAGSLAAPNYYVSSTKDATPVSSAGAIASYTGGFTVQIGSGNGHFYWNGITINNEGTINLSGTAAGSFVTVFDSCTFNITSGAAAYTIAINGTGGTPTVQLAYSHIKNCTFSFSATNQYFVLGCASAHIQGGGIAPTSAAISTVFGGLNSIRTVALTVSNFDMSAAATNATLVAAGNGCKVLLKNCKLPTGWNGSLVSSNSTGSRVEMYNCDAGTTNYRLWVSDVFGSTQSDSTVYLNADTGSDKIGWKMTASSNVGYPYYQLVSPDMAVWSDAVGASRTATVEIVYDDATALTNKQVWLEVDYPGSKTPQYVSASSRNSDVGFGAGASVTTSDAAWVGVSGFANLKKAKLSVTFTPQAKGLVYARVYVSKASEVVYVNPVVTLSA